MARFEHEFRLVLTSPTIGREEIRMADEKQAKAAAALWKNRVDNGTIGHVERRAVTPWRRVGAKPRAKAELHPWEEGDLVEHIVSGWSGPIISYDGRMVTVRPTSPRPKEILNPNPMATPAFIPTPDDWPGWKAITVHVGELRRLAR